MEFWERFGIFKLDVHFASLFPKRTRIRIIFKKKIGGSGLWAPERSTGPLGPPLTPQHSDPHPCIRPPSWGTQLTQNNVGRVSLGETSEHCFAANHSMGTRVAFKSFQKRASRPLQPHSLSRGSPCGTGNPFCRGQCLLAESLP